MRKQNEEKHTAQQGMRASERERGVINTEKSSRKNIYAPSEIFIPQ